MKLFMKKALAIGLSGLFCLGFAACDGGGFTPTKPPLENGYLHISAVKLGYGVEWLEAMAEAFEEEKQIAVDISTVVGSAGLTALDNELESLASTTDLFFNKRGWFAEDVYRGSITVGGKSYDCLYADVSDVWNAVVDEGSELTIKDKMDPLYVDAFNIEGKYYSLPWAGGVYGIVRNIDAWNTLGFTENDVPLTTDELFELCDKIIEKDTDIAPFIYALQEEYYTSWIPIFFGQYEGVANVKQFMEGKDPLGKVSQNVYAYDGQVEAVKIMEELIGTEGYQHNSSTAIDFTSMQGHFLSGKVAVFCINGSWLENEMKSTNPSANIDVIKTPVISSLVNKLSFGKTLSEDAADDKLAECIQYVDAVDAGEKPSMPSGVTTEDIQKVTEARHYAYMAGGIDHQAYIPAYAENIDQAKEFLKFMYSDKGMQIYYETVGGATLPASPIKDYDSTGMELSVFRKSVNAAAEEGFLFDREPKARYYVLAQVSTYFTNGISPVDAIREGKTAQDIIDKNNAEVAKKWPSIQQLLGLI